MEVQTNGPTGNIHAPNLPFYKLIIYIELVWGCATLPVDWNFVYIYKGDQFIRKAPDNVFFLVGRQFARSSTYKKNKTKNTF